jgi:transcriptional regulator with XRE-family HTH domain
MNALSPTNGQPKAKRKRQLDSVLCSNLSYYRSQLGITQREMGHRLGIKLRRYAQWETYDCEPSSKYIVLLADIFGITTDELLGRQSLTTYQGAQL